MITLVAYIPAMHGGYIWDDDDYITDNSTLRTADGLGKIWFELGAVPQYYPLVHTTFWVEYHLWQLQPFGYHLVNVLLHALNGVLLGLVLRYLRVPGAWLAAAFFALHPVHVESVAWITERKNVLSVLFYLSSLLAYLRFANLHLDPANTSASSSMHPLTSGNGRRLWRFYTLALFLYLCALLTKTVTASMPAAILLVLWWKRDRVGWRDVLALVPFFAVGAVLGLTTVWMEKHFVGAQGAAWALSFVDRCLIAGRALWFYASKLLWPHKLTFIYPRWQIDSGIWWQYLFPLFAVAVILILWLSRNRLGKGPLVAVLFFAGTLVPALGFFDIYPMRFSFVADHFQYLASIGLIVLGVAGFTTFLKRLGTLPRNIGFAACLGVLFVFGVHVWQQGNIYRDSETLYRDTISKNPGAWMAHNNLGAILTEQDRLDEAIAHFSKVLRINPDYAEAHYNLGHVLVQQGKLKEAAPHLRQALRINPDHAEAHNTLGYALVRQGQLDEAASHLRQALRINPDYADAHNNLGNVLTEQGRLDEAIAHFSTALQTEPDHEKALNSLGKALARQGKNEEALAHFSKALQLNPNSAGAHNNLGNILEHQGRINEALYHYSMALQLKPGFADAYFNLGNLLARQGKSEEAIVNFSLALQLKPEFAEAHNSLGVVLARRGKLKEAIDHFREAIRINPHFRQAHRNLSIALQQAGGTEKPPTTGAIQP